MPNSGGAARLRGGRRALHSGVDELVRLGSVAALSSFPDLSPREAEISFCPTIPPPSFPSQHGISGYQYF